jgi:bla regulator protein blaR1
MTPTWMTPDLMRNLALSLLHFLWQGLALTALASVAMACCRRSSVRYAAGVVALAVMLVAPVITFLVISEENSTLSWSGQITTSSAGTLWMARRTQPPPSSNPKPLSTDLLSVVVEIWAAGVLLFSLRAAGGFLVIERMRRKKSSPLSAALMARCMALQKRLGLERVIRYCECTRLEAPAVIGWMRPVVLVPVAALAGLSPEQLDAVIAHELAHIKRLDAFVNVFQMVAETLLFYHPAVWWLSKRIRVERENCCDDVAISISGNPVEYARALTLMEEWRTAPVLALALTRSPLAERIMRMLGTKTWRSGMRSAGLVLSIVCLALAFVAGNSLLGIVHPMSAAQSSAPAPATPQSTITSHPKPSPQGNATPKPSPSSRGEEQTSSGSYIDQMKAAGLDHLTPDELISLKVQGVTPEYVRGIRQQGFQPTADELVSLRVQSVTPEYIRDLRAQGLSLAFDQLIGMKVQGITPAYVQRMRAEGLQVDADRLIGMKVQGATPEYVRDLKSLGLKFDADEVIAMSVQSLTPEYVRKIQALGLHPSVDELIAMRVQRVTPEWVRDLGAMGLKVDADRLISMRVQSISAEYVKALQDEGLKLDADELISAKVQGITPEFVEEVRKHGFTHLDLNKLLELKRDGIFERPQADI